VLRVRGWLENDNWKVRWVGRRASRDPELQALVDVVPDDCTVLLDPKERTAERRAELADRVLAHGFDASRFCVSTQDDDELRRYRDAGFRSWRTVGNRRELARVLAAGPRPDEAVSVRHTLLSEATVERLHTVVPAVVAWTVNTAGTAGRLRAMGVDGLTTDRREVMTYAAA
jgi:glycerophosphoryl diester phosphodiesterase